MGSIISCNPRVLEPSASGFRSSHVASSSARYTPGWEIPASFCAKYGNIIEENGNDQPYLSTKGSSLFEDFMDCEFQDIEYMNIYKIYIYIIICIYIYTNMESP